MLYGIKGQLTLIPNKNECCPKCGQHSFFLKSIFGNVERTVRKQRFTADIDGV